MASYFRNAISKLYNTVRAPVAATRDALADRLQSIRESVALLYKRAKEKLGYKQEVEEKIAPQRTLKDVVEEQAKQDYVGIEDIKHLYPQEKTRSMKWN